MVTYNVTQSATSNASGNTEDVWIEVTAPAGQEIDLKRLKIFYDGGATAVGDNTVSVRVVSFSSRAIGAVSSATIGTASPTALYSRVTSCTVDVKNGSTAFGFSSNGVGSVFLQPRFNERGFYEWVPRDYTEFIEGVPGGTFAVILKNSAVSRVMITELEWEE